MSSAPRADSSAKGAFLIAILLILVGVAIDDGTVAWLLAPFVLTLLVYAMAKVPLRSSLLVLMFVAFTIENPSEMPGAGHFETPFFNFGKLMMVHLKKTTGLNFLVVSGMEMFIGLLALIHFVRRSTGSKIDRIGAAATPKPLIRLAQLSLAGTLFVWMYGLIRGGDSSMALWQVNAVFYLPVVFLLFQAGLRGPGDHEALARVVLFAACLRACQAVYVQWTADPEPDPFTGSTWLAYATTHHDSMLFAWAAVILLSLLIQRAGKRAVWLAVLMLPILFAGMIANNRRIVWVHVIIVFATVYFATPPNAFKRRVTKMLTIASPAILAYVVVGWFNPVGIFKPMKTIRSVIDAKSDNSTMWREAENFNLIYTFREQPIFGTGYGHGFIEVWPLPEVDYSLERFLPHNSLLGLLTYSGFVGFTAMTLLWVAGIYFAMRAYYTSRTPHDRAAALVCLGAVPIYYLHCYGDIGLGTWTGVFMVAPAITVAGKLATATGAWPVGQRARAESPAAASPSVDPTSPTATSP